jgi:hypothetical protein
MLCWHVDKERIMALPRENKTEKVTNVQEAVAKMSPQEIGALPGLDDEDFRLFGTLVQHFSFIDLNLRRALEIFHLAKRLPEKAAKSYPDIPDAELTDVMTEIVKVMDAQVEPIEESLTWLEAISRCRGFRNLVGHFAAKRYPNADVYVFASKSERDARRVMGASLSKHHVHFVIAGRSEFFEMVEGVGDSQNWLAAKVPKWSEQYLKQKPQEAAGVGMLRVVRHTYNDQGQLAERAVLSGRHQTRDEAVLAAKSEAAKNSPSGFNEKTGQWWITDKNGKVHSLLIEGY